MYKLSIFWLIFILLNFNLFQFIRAQSNENIRIYPKKSINNFHPNLIRNEPNENEIILNYSNLYFKLNSDFQNEFNNLKSILLYKNEIENEAIKLQIVDLFLKLENQQYCKEIVNFWLKTPMIKNDNYDNYQSNPFQLLSLKLNSIQLKSSLNKLFDLLIINCSENFNEIMENIDQWILKKFTPKNVILN